MDYPENSVYYRLYLSNNKPVIVELQWFDEYDYDERLFLTEERYKTEEEAKKMLVNWLSIRPIDNR